MKIRVNDQVKVIAGKDKGKIGTVTRVLVEESRVVVDGVNKAKRHVKAKQGQSGQIVEFSASIHASNVQMICPKTNKATRIGYTITEAGEKVRIAKISGEVIPTKFKKQ